MAYAKYLPPKRDWTNRFGEQASFSSLVQHLLHLNLNTQSCAGTHIFQALVTIDNADRRYSILDNDVRNQLDSYITITLQQVVRKQQSDGSWAKQWCDSINNDYTGPMTSFQYAVLVTGHLTEVLNILD